MESNTSKLAGKLVDEFKQLHSKLGHPTWAWEPMPSIPLVGASYSPGGGLLMYGSAENLTHLKHPFVYPRFSGESAWDRYRYEFEECAVSSECFFPKVGIEPISSGGLLTAGLLVAQR